MAGSVHVHRQKVYVQITELRLLAKALRAASIPPESPAKTRQIDPHFTSYRRAVEVFKEAARLTNTARETLSVPHVGMPA